MNDNLTKIRPGNVKNFEIRCDFCGYTLKGNIVNDIVCRANDLGWKYDYENDRVICRNCQKESKMNNNLLALIDGRDKAKASVAAYEKRIMAIICDAVRDIIPDLEGWLGTPDNPNKMIFLSEQFGHCYERMPKEKNENWENLHSLIEEIFPELRYQLDDNDIYLSPEEQIKIIKRLKKLRGEKNEKKKS